MGMVVARFEVYLVRLDPTQGHEIQKTRPCVVISPDEMFQSSPNPKVGRYLISKPVMPHSLSFQSSPNPKVGRYPIYRP